MKLICQIEGCGHLSENRDIGLCATHAREARKKAAPKAKPARKRIAKQSEEGKERAELYRAIRALFIAVNTRCLAAIAKYKKKKGEFIESVIRIDTIDRFD